jgi:hypothetical protein
MTLNPARLLPGLRVAVGLQSWVSPSLTGKVFGLPPEDIRGGAYPLRLFGVRDLALAAGPLLAPAGQRKLWWQLGIACDVADVAAAAVSAREGRLPATTAILGGVVAAGAAALGVAALSAER